MFKSTRLWRGISVILIFFFTNVIILGSLAFKREGDVNLFLQLSPPVTEGTGDSLYYPSVYNSKEEFLEAEKQLNIKLQEEGTVLLYNNNHTLPLSENERSTTLFGRSSVDPVYKGNGGSAMNSNPTSLVKALQNEGFSLNSEMSSALSSSPLRRKQGDIAEVSVGFYTNALKNTYANDFNDVAIITLSRFGGEMSDMVAKNPGDSSEGSMMRDANGDPLSTDGVPMLSLHPQEKDMLEMVKDSGKFGKIVVLLNTAYPMDAGEIANYADAILWIGNPGTYGFEGVANVLVGKADPSGRTADTFATNSLSSPAMRNYGDFQFDNLSTLYKNKYLIYAEGIYVGYKYYETRYYDQILGVNNANSAKGVYSGNGGWDYSEEIVYPFGYGSNYAEFSQSIEEIGWDRNTNKVTAVVKVTNNGSHANSNFDSENKGSKSVVQLYAQLPYIIGGAEKSAIQLIGFGKTGELKKGQSELVAIEIDDYVFATYDNKAVNGADETKLGAYVFDPGDYYFAIGNDVHDALNNIMAKQGHVNLRDSNGDIVVGDENKAHKETLLLLDNVTHARSHTGEIVSNQFDDIDINYFLDEGSKVTYLTRSDWNTYPDPILNLHASNEMKSQMEDRQYSKPEDAPNISSFNYGTSSSKVDIKFIEMKDVAWDDDETWNLYLDQFTVQDLYTIPGERMANAAIPRIGIPANVAGDGPSGLQRHSVQLPCEVVAASTFNLELLEEVGEMLGEQAQHVNQHGTYGPGANFHRVPYNGRNQEYYSEDPMVSYYMAAAQIKGSRKKGFVTFIKHFALNDQEVNRHGVATMLDEQTYREVYLKAFEGAFVLGESLGTMTSYARIGLVPSGSHYPTMTQVLRNEWGFKGLNITDSSKDAVTYMYTAESIIAGTNQFNNDPDRSTDIKTLLINDRDGYIWQFARDNLKYYTHVYLNSFVSNGLTPDVEVVDWVPWWKPAIKNLEITLGVLSVAGLTMTALSIYVFNRKKGKEQ